MKHQLFLATTPRHQRKLDGADPGVRRGENEETSEGSMPIRMRTVGFEAK